MRASAASVASSAVSLWEVTALAISDADGVAEAAVMTIFLAGSGSEDTGRLGFVGQREFVDQPCHPQRHFQISAHRASPCVLDRQAQGRSDGGDVIVDHIRGHFSPNNVL